jgi:uncharacterized protein
VRIWVDLANSPQVLFFRPIIADLRERGHEVVITSRDFAQTVQLADSYGMAHTPLGRHGGRKWGNIVRQTFGRSAELAKWARSQGPFDLAVSHNSYSQALAATWLRVPFVTLMDYEHQPFNHVCFRLARRVIVPEAFPDEALAKYGARRKTSKFPGLKEQVYLSDFVPAPNYLEENDIPEERVIIALRPPAPWAAYHRFENPLFDTTLNMVADRSDTFVVFLPRIPAQGDAVKSLGYPNVWVPPRALDGPNLLYHADMVISGGGTMNREAAVLGTPVYTVFKGQLGSVDRYLTERGRMVQISEVEDLSRMAIRKRNGHVNTMIQPGLVQVVTDLILQAG